MSLILTYSTMHITYWNYFHALLFLPCHVPTFLFLSFLIAPLLFSCEVFFPHRFHTQEETCDICFSESGLFTWLLITFLLFFHQIYSPVVASIPVQRAWVPPIPSLGVQGVTLPTTVEVHSIMPKSTFPLLSDVRLYVCGSLLIHLMGFMLFQVLNLLLLLLSLTFFFA